MAQRSRAPARASSACGANPLSYSGMIFRSWRPHRRRVRALAEEAGLVREHDCLDAVAEAELLQDVRDVRLDGSVADVELLTDLRVREAARDEAEDVELPLGQLVERLWRRRV